MAAIARPDAIIAKRPGPPGEYCPHCGEKLPGEEFVADFHQPRTAEVHEDQLTVVRSPRPIERAPLRRERLAYYNPEAATMLVRIPAGERPIRDRLVGEEFSPAEFHQPRMAEVHEDQLLVVRPPGPIRYRAPARRERLLQEEMVARNPDYYNPEPAQFMLLRAEPVQTVARQPVRVSPRPIRERPPPRLRRGEEFTPGERHQPLVAEEHEDRYIIRPPRPIKRVEVMMANPVLAREVARPIRVGRGGPPVNRPEEEELRGDIHQPFRAEEHEDFDQRIGGGGGPRPIQKAPYRRQRLQQDRVLR